MFGDIYGFEYILYVLLHYFELYCRRERRVTLAQLKEGKLYFRDHRFKIALIAVGVGVFLYLAIGSWSSKVNSAERKVHRAWIVLNQSCEQRVQLLTQFVQLIQTFAPQAQEVLQPLIKSYEGAANYKATEKILSDQSATQEYITLQKNIYIALMQMEVKAPNYPDFGQNRQYFMLKLQLQGIEQQIIFAMENLNQGIDELNYYITGFPFNWANTLFVRAKPRYPLHIDTLEKPSLQNQ